MTKSIYAFRVDSSNAIGYGHLMRCLTLATELKKNSIESCFISANLDFNSQSKIIEMGHESHILPYFKNQAFDIKEDAKETKLMLERMNVEWLIVDHYAIDIYWESELKETCKHIMVIDDLANRSHHCEVLLDQNLGKKESHYKHLVPNSCKILTGLSYALIRDEFLEIRDESLKHRKNGFLKNILISLGGSDPDNFSSKVLEKLFSCNLSRDKNITVIMNSNSQYLDEIKSQLKQMPHKSHLFIDVNNMGNILKNQDIVIGAVGVSAWERCCLGIPSISLVIASNQKPGAKALHLSGASIVIDQEFSDGHNLESALEYFIDPQNLHNASNIASNLVEGFGTKRVVNFIT